MQGLSNFAEQRTGRTSARPFRTERSGGSDTTEVEKNYKSW
jgi:hypothetical protein